ncbi:organic cation transporter protein isoform X2 [Manduca sexta]|uniref:organic cation transporter protein isoform X2 n=1 Tax=Manduca sexta TaxID=7130 RepID=UPI00188E76D6|nr:organic cation transporter protein isoform X2 [Manduca sexta]
MEDNEARAACLIPLQTYDSATVERRSSSDHHAMESKTEPLSQDPETPRTKVDLDTILVEELGQFGRYQLRTLALAAGLVIFAAWAATEYVFTTARISTRCLIPECETSASALFSPDWIFNAVPASGSGFDNCQRFANSSTSIVSSETCPAALFDNNNVIQCEEYVYENTHSVVYDYGMACDEWRRTLIGSIRTTGTLTALPITGFVSDRWGRKTALVINAFNTAFIGATRYFADTYIGFAISEFAEAMFGSGGFSTAYILVMEVMGPKYRVAAGATINTFFSVGQVTMGLIAWGVPNWRLLTLTLYVPQFITILYIWLISESIRWYMSKGRYAESEAVLKKAAKINGKQLSDKSLAALRETAEEEKRTRALEAAQNVNEPWLIVQVFRNKRILIRCLVSPVWWITNTFIYYGMSINAVNIAGNRYVNYMAVSASEIPGYWTAYFLMSKIGRKPVLMGAFWICCACQIAYIFMPQGLYALSLTVYLIGKFSIAMVMTSVYVYTAELYPTKYRHSLFAFSSMVGRIGGIIAPLTPAFGASTFEKFPFVLFACFAFVSGLLIMLTPETLGTKLPDTMKEASDIGNKSKNKIYE